MTEDEDKIVELLGKAWNSYLALPDQHPQDQHDMLHAIHTAQRIVMARPTLRNMKASGK
jgi:hypothetical protein